MQKRISKLIVRIQVLMLITVFISVSSVFNVKAATATVAVPVSLEYSSVSEFNNGLAAVSVDDDAWVRGERWGFINESGKVVVPLEYDSVESFSNGLAQVFKYDENAICGYKYGFVNTEGKLAIPLIYDGHMEADLHTAYFNKDGYAKAFVDNKCGVIDKTGTFIIKPQFDFMGEAGEEVFSDGIWQIVGNYVDYPNSYKSTRGVIDITGKLVIPFDTYNWVGHIFDGYYRFYKEDYECAIIDRTTKMVVPFGEYDNISYSLEEGLIVVEKDSKYGAIDTNCNIVIPIEYDSLGPFSEGLAYFKKGLSIGFIDRTNNVVLSFDSKYVPADNYSLPYFSSGLAELEESNGRYVYINKAGAVVIPSNYNVVYSYLGIDEYLTVYSRDEKLYGLLDNTGAVVIPFGEYENIGYVNEGLVTVKKDGKYGIVRISNISEVKADTMSKQAVPTKAIVSLDGKELSFDAYNIDGYNYFKLRDLAYALSDTSAMFDVAVDNNIVNIIKNNKYIASGNEMAAKGTDKKEAMQSKFTFYMDKVKIDLAAYNIGGNNYVKLRDLASALNFNVSYINGAIVIEPDENYTAD